MPDEPHAALFFTAAMLSHPPDDPRACVLELKTDDDSPLRLSAMGHHSPSRPGNDPRTFSCATTDLELSPASHRRYLYRALTARARSLHVMCWSAEHVPATPCAMAISIVRRLFLPDAFLASDTFQLHLERKGNMQFLDMCGMGAGKWTQARLTCVPVTACSAKTPVGPECAPTSGATSSAGQRTAALPLPDRSWNHVR